MPHLIASRTPGTVAWTSARQCSRIGRAKSAALAILSSIRGSRSISPLPLVRQQQHRGLYKPFHFLHAGRGPAVVAGDREVHQLALFDALAAHAVGDEHRPFDDAIGSEDRHFGAVD